MLLAHGWVVTQSSRESYNEHCLDEVSEQANKALWRRFRDWVDENTDPFMVWQLTERLNNHQGLLQFTISRNHRGTTMGNMLSWLAKSSDSTYGLVYVHDDEDLKDNHNYGRGEIDYSNHYRVWRILRGRSSRIGCPFYLADRAKSYFIF